MRALFYPSYRNSQPKTTWCLTLRDGLPPIEDPNLSMVAQVPNGSHRTGLKISPDQTKGVYFRHWSSTAYIYHFEMTSTGWTTNTAATAAFSGVVTDCFTSDDYYGFVGDSSSYITAFRWLDHSLITLTKTGLGTINRCSIHPVNGYQLMVSHQTSPFLRIYDLRDGSYIEPITALPNRTNTCSWSGDGNWAICTTEVNPYVVKYDAALTTRTTISTSSQYRPVSSYISSYSYSFGPYTIPHPTKPDCAIMCTTNNPTSGYVRVFEVNASTDTITDIESYPNENTVSVGFQADVAGNTLYVWLSPDDADVTNCFLAYDLTTYARKPELESNMPFGYSTEARPMIIINKDYGQITGTVRDVNNNPVARVIRVYRRADGILMAQTTSDAVTGDYTVIVPTDDVEAYDVQFMTESGELLNDLIYARVTPSTVA